MEVKKFEDLVVWQKARVLTNEIYKITKKSEFSKDLGLKDQIQRASVSIMSNIAEGFERGSKEEFIQFLYIARGSCGEVRTQLYVAKDQNYITEEEFQKLQKLAVEVSRLIYHLIEAVKTSSFRGQKFKKTYRPFHEEIAEFLKSFASATSDTFATSAAPDTHSTSDTAGTADTSNSEISGDKK
jgi:four helix bundle protein